MPLAEDEPTLTIEEAGMFAGLSRAAAYQAAARGELPLQEAR